MLKVVLVVMLRLALIDKNFALLHVDYGSVSFYTVYFRPLRMRA